MIEIPMTKDFAKTIERNSYDGSEPCCVCGKPIKRENIKYACLSWQGAYLITEDEFLSYPEAERDSSDSGLVFIGSDCLRKYKQLKPYLHQPSCGPFLGCE